MPWRFSRSRNIRKAKKKLLILSWLLSSASGTVFIPQFNVSYPSMPAMFGRKWSEDKSVTAHLQMITERPLLCKDEADSEQTSQPQKIADNHTVVTTPSDGKPVVLLAERGECTFFEKSVVASAWDPVKYLIVYDNEISPQLVPMSSEYPSSDMALLFVSYRSGIELQDMILQQMKNTSTNAQYGILIEMNGVSPLLSPPIPELTLTGYMLAAMTGFLAFLIFFGCVLLCAQAGIITAHPDDRGRIVLFAGGSGPRQVAMRLISNGHGLLTEEQVSGLDEEIFSTSPGEEDAMCCCAICLEEFEDGETVRMLPCEHKFHDACLIPWLTERHSSCPLCKFDVLEHIIKQQTSLSEEQNSANGDDESDNSDAVYFSLSMCWMHIRQFGGGWTLLGGQEHSHETHESDRDPEDHPSEIEMENTAARRQTTASPSP